MNPEIRVPEPEIINGNHAPIFLMNKLVNPDGITSYIVIHVVVPVNDWSIIVFIVYILYAQRPRYAMEPKRLDAVKAFLGHCISPISY